MTEYHELVRYHLATILPAFAIGTYLMARRKGDRLHRTLGKTYMLLMLATAIITLVMPAQVGPRLFGHFGFIHGFALLTLYMVPTALLAARRGDIQMHRKKMIGLYIGGLVIAGAFAFMPGRMLNGWITGAPVAALR